MNSDNDKTYRVINFDLDTKKIKETGISKQKVYSDIKKFFISHDFKHKQWSGYVSNNPITQMKLKAIIRELTIKLPILGKVIREFDITVVDSKLSAVKYIKDTIELMNNIALQDEEANRKQLKKEKNQKDIMERALDMLINDNKKDNPIAKRTNKKEDCLER